MGNEEKDPQRTQMNTEANVRGLVDEGCLGRSPLRAFWKCFNVVAPRVDYPPAARIA